MIIDIDAGNTRIKWQASLGDRRIDVGAEQLSERPLLSVHAVLSSRGGISRIRLLSVRSQADTAILVDAVKSLWSVEPEMVTSSAAACGVTNSYSQANTLGADRWSAIIAGAQRAKQATGSMALCVVDAGSALTIDLVDDCGVHQGGYIAPGLSMQLRSLNQGTGNIALANIPPEPDLQPALNTRDAVIAGVLLGAQQLILAAVMDFEQQQGVKPLLLVTGGDGPRLLGGLSKLSVEAQYSPHLVLEGMAFLRP